jgi:GNAT superfamily N-acetyltransferase
MEIREYTRKNRLACLRVLDSNIPGFFKPEARDDFTDYLDELDTPGHTFFVLENHAKLVLACSGVYIFPGAVLASLHWGMVARAYHRTGLGSALLEYRLNWLRETAIVQEVLLSTTQSSSAFFERFGFAIEKTLENHDGIGVHQVEMRLKLYPS